MNLETFRHLIKSWENAECIYKESRILCHGRITQIQPDAQRIKAQLIVIPTVGFSPGFTSSELSATWKYFSFDTDHWSVSMTGLVWEVYFNPNSIREITQLAPSLLALTEAQKQSW